MKVDNFLLIDILTKTYKPELLGWEAVIGAKYLLAQPNYFLKAFIRRELKVIKNKRIVVFKKRAQKYLNK